MLVLSSPSGAGKTTICKKIINLDKKISMSVSYTTRPKRKSERNGVDYFFVSKEKFENLFRSAQAEIDFDRRIESVRRLSKYVQEEAIAVAIGETRMGFYINPKTVKSLGYQPQPLTLFIQNIELK